MYLTKEVIQFLIEQRKKQSMTSAIELGENIANSLEHSIPDKKIRIRLLTLKITIREAHIERLKIMLEYFQSSTEYHDQKYGSPKLIKCPICETERNYPVTSSKDQKHMRYHCINCDDEFLVTIEEWKEESKRVEAHSLHILKEEEKLGA